MSQRFQGSVALIAGGTGGLGRAVALAFLEEGARVSVTYRNIAEFELLKMAAADEAANLAGYAVDVTDEAAVRQLVAEVSGAPSGKSGRLDVLVNAVGGYAGGVALWDLESTTFDTM